MPHVSPRLLAVGVLLLVPACLFFATRVLARRTHFPGALWAAFAYLLLLHLSALVPLLVSPMFASGLAQLTVVSFPANIVFLRKWEIPSPTTFAGLWQLYFRFVLFSGTVDACIVAVVVRLMLRPRPLA